MTDSTKRPSLTGFCQELAVDRFWRDACRPGSGDISATNVTRGDKNVEGTMKTMLRRSRIARVATLAILVVTASAAAAGEGGWDADLRAGVYADDVEGPFVGIGGLKRLGNGQWYFNPNAEAAFGDRIDLVTLNGDFHYDFREIDTKTTAFWAGGGLAVVNVEPDRGDDDLDIGVNAVLGVGAKKGRVRPFGQLKVVVYDEVELVLAGGIRF